MSKEIVIAESELVAIMKEVEEHLASLTKSEDSAKLETVTKAEDSKDKSKEASKEPAKEASPSAELAPGEDAPKAPVADEAPPAAAQDPIDESAMAAPKDVSPMESAQEVAPDPAAQDGVIEPAPTVAELQAEYEKLSDEELALHLMAAKSAASARNAAAVPAAPALPEAPAPAPQESTPVDAMLGKKELSKSNEKLASLEKELASLKIEKDKQTEALNKLYEAYTAPVRKSLKFISDLPPSKVELPVDVKSLSKEQVTAKLSAKTRDPELKKSDRDLVSQYYAGTVKLEALEHLLK